MEKKYINNRHLIMGPAAIEETWPEKKIKSVYKHILICGGRSFFPQLE